eukprot:950980-Pyramimonas_sp.AAC.1
MHAAPRLVMRGVSVSSALEPGKSIVAGSPRGVDMAKVMLHCLLQEAHVASPRAGLWTFIDDTVCRTESARTTVIGDMKSAAQSIAQLFKDNRLTISDKTKLVASDDALGSSLVTSLKSMGIPVTLTPSAVDLGVDAAGDRRRARPKIRTR